MSEIKKATTYDEQLRILSSRGVVIDDPARCKAALEAINYYRFTAYFLPFKKPTGEYETGTSFLRVHRLYEFDRKLRRILFSALEEVEISLRAKISYYHAHKYGPTGYLDPANYKLQYNHTQFLETIEREIKANEKVPFVAHHIKNYNGTFPIWAITELFTFGMLSRFYSNMQTADQKALFGRKYEKVGSWLKCCSDLRNICAHYGRLYFRVFPSIPAGLNGVPTGAARRLWGAVLALREMYPDAEKWNNEIVASLDALFEEYREDINLYHIAFPNNWRETIRKK